MDLKTITNLGIEQEKAKQFLSDIEMYILKEVELKEEAIKKNYEKEMEKAKLDFYIEKELILAGARNIKATKALIDFENLGKQKITQELIKQLIQDIKMNEETKFLFYEDEQTKKFKGFKPFESNINNSRKNEKMNYEELCNYYEMGRL